MLKKVPALLLQPLIENSIKHGYSYDHTDLEIIVSIYEENSQLVISVKNNGAPVNQSHKELMKKGVGLVNINDRLKNLYGDSYYFEIRNRKNTSGVETLIRIPE